MAKDIERRVVLLTCNILQAEVVATPSWIMRPGRDECRADWPLVSRIYAELTDMILPEAMRPVERRSVDAVLVAPGHRPRILEIDETQHFNDFRATTLRAYAGKRPLAFDAEAWLARSLAKKRLEGGGFAVARPPLFPGTNGRHRQRAFRDALSDIVPLQHEFAPTLRIADFEVKDWIFSADATDRLQLLLKERLASL